MNIINKHRVAQLAERSECTSERLCGSNPTPMILFQAQKNAQNVRNSNRSRNFIKTEAKMMGFKIIANLAIKFV